MKKFEDKCVQCGYPRLTKHKRNKLDSEYEFEDIYECQNCGATMFVRHYVTYIEDMNQDEDGTLHKIPWTKVVERKINLMGRGYYWVKIVDERIDWEKEEPVIGYYHGKPEGKYPWLIFDSDETYTLEQIKPLKKIDYED